jgi:hypothetical protein
VRASCAILAAAVFAAACSNAGEQHRARLSKVDDLRIDQTWRTPESNRLGAPLDGLAVGGFITNTGTTPLRCSATAFVIIDEAGNAFTPHSLWCTTPTIGPHLFSSFTAEFTTLQGSHVELRFEHPDGTYEAHTLVVPPA